MSCRHLGFVGTMSVRGIGKLSRNLIVLKFVRAHLVFVGQLA
jgi:hypothetical protein